MSRCTCKSKAIIQGENTPRKSNHVFSCPELKPRLFYYEEALNAYIPASEMLENIINLDNFESHGESIEIEFIRFDMSDDEFNNLPED